MTTQLITQSLIIAASLMAGCGIGTMYGQRMALRTATEILQMVMDETMTEDE